MRLVVHLGMSKTGSTAIQSTLVANRARLRQMGVHYPDRLGVAEAKVAAHQKIGLHQGLHPPVEVQAGRIPRRRTLRGNGVQNGKVEVGFRGDGHAVSMASDPGPRNLRARNPRPSAR